MSIIENRIPILLAALSKARMGATVGLWMNAPDLAGWLLREGRSYQWTPVALPSGVRPGKTSDCYRDAQNLALTQGRFTYCEGYAMLGPNERPVPHAWCVSHHRGNVVDATWSKFKTTGRQYFGVSFQTPFVRLFQQKPGTELAILLWSEAGWPVQNGLLHASEWRAEESRCRE